MLEHKDKLLIMMGAPKKKIEPQIDDSDSEDESEGDESDLHSEGLKAAMSDFIAAVHAKDSEGAAEAFKNAFECASKAPSDENEQEGEESDSEYK